MIKQAPTPGRIMVMAAFALSCFGLLLFLWLSFGGPVPLKPQSYRFSVKFPEATQLTKTAEVRISGVRVGTVTNKDADPETGLTEATIEMKPKYAPIPRDTRTILRQKTLLGETYVELSPGHKSSGNLPDGGSLPLAQVAPTVELDEIFRSFDEPTRKAFQIWLRDQGRGVGERGRSISDGLAYLAPFAQNTDRVLDVLHRNENSTRSLVRDTGAVFEALSERKGQLADLVVNANRVFATTAARNESLADAVRVLPTFLRESRLTINRLTPFALDTNPLVTQLRPAARQLTPTLIDLAEIAPDLDALFRNLRPLIRVSRRGLPALEDVIGETQPVLEQLDPFLRQVVPISDYLGLFNRETSAFFANVPASTQATDTPPGASGPVHYLRLLQGLRPEDLAAYPTRVPESRLNPYPQPGGLDELSSGLDVFGGYLCGGTSAPPLSAQLIAQLNASDPTLVPNIISYAYGGNPANVPTPACRAQQPLGRLVGQPGVYPRLQPAR